MLWFNVSPSLFRVTHCIYTALSFYLLAGLIRYFYLERCTARLDCSNCSNATATFDSESGRGDTKSLQRRRLSTYRRSRLMRRASDLMMGLSLLAGVLTFLHVILDLWAFSVQDTFSLGMLCNRQKWSGIMIFLIAMCVYTFLWIRQRVFYSHPVLRKLSSPVLNRFSWSVLFTIIFSITMFIVAYYATPSDIVLDSEKEKMFNYFVDHDSNTWHIVYQTNNTTTWNPNSTFPRYSCTFKSKILFLSSHFIITGTFLYFQISLQFLFAYPVMKQRCHRKETISRSNSNDEKRNQTQTSDNDDKSTFLAENIDSLTTSCDPGFYEKSATLTNSFKKNLSSSNCSLSNFFPTTTSTLRQAHSESSIKAASSNQLYRKCLNTVHSKKINEINCKDRRVFEKAKTLTSHTSYSESKLTGLKYQSDANKKNWIFKQNASFRRKSRRTSRRRLKRYVWRCFFVSMLCCVSDIIAFAINVYTQISSHEKYANEFPKTLNDVDADFYLNNFVVNGTDNKQQTVFEERVTVSLLSVLAYNGNMVINLLGVVLCYDKWTSMLFPCCARRCTKDTS